MTTSVRSQTYAAQSATVLDSESEIYGILNFCGPIYYEITNVESLNFGSALTFGSASSDVYIDHSTGWI